jgi:hypothetical protein
VLPAGGVEVPGVAHAAAERIKIRTRVKLSAFFIKMTSCIVYFIDILYKSKQIIKKIKNRLFLSKNSVKLTEYIK